MLLGKWGVDAEKLSSQLPPGEVVTNRVNYLLESVLPRGCEVDASIFDERTKRALSIPQDAFLVVERSALVATRSALGRRAKTMLGIAYVFHSTILPSVLVLPAHQAEKTLGHGAILLHELDHVTEKDDGTVNESERRAYKLNTDVMVALDGSDFDDYIDRWPVTFTTDFSESVSIAFHDIACPEPPKETFTHDLWAENGTSRTILQSIGRMATLERVMQGLPEDLIDRLADTLQE